MNLEKVRVEFQSKNNHRTLFLKVWANAAEEPQAMYDALTKIGWKPETIPPAPPIPAEHCYSGGYAKGDQTMIVERFFHKDGSALFNGWTPKENKTNMPIVRNALRKFGFVRVGHRQLTLGDCL